MFIKELLDQMWVMPALVTTGSSVAIVATSKWHGAFSHDHSEGVQKFHTAPTPRIGGLAILIGLLAAWATLSGSEAHLLLGMMLLAGLPAFVMGFAEDLTKRVGVNARLLATIVSGIAACFFTGYSLTHIDIWGIDALLLIPLLSVAFTAFAVGGVANSVNIIDGFNGLAGGTLAICFTAMGFIAHSVGDTELTTISLALVIVLAGFLVVNFPFGKLFLGDGGAYLLGFLLAWMAVMLPMRNPSVSVWAPLVICAYPFNETIYSMARRYLNKSNPGEPDSEHLAQPHQNQNHPPSLQLTPAKPAQRPGFTHLLDRLSGKRSSSNNALPEDRPSHDCMGHQFRTLYPHVPIPDKAANS